MGTYLIEFTGKSLLRDSVEAVAKEVRENPYRVVDEALDIVVETGLRGEMRGFRVYTTIGGPTIWVAPDGVHGVWEGDEVFIPLSRDEGVDRVWEYLEMLRG